MRCSAEPSPALGGGPDPPLPTYAWLGRFTKDFDGLTSAQQALFLAAVAQFVDDLREGRSFRTGLRVKGIQGAAGVFEMAWAEDGRATFEYGNEVIKGETHIVWRRIGTHSIFQQP